MNKKQTLVVTGASGNLGRLVLDSLLQMNLENKIIATTRTPKKLAAYAQKGVEVRKADFNDIDSLMLAFKEADRLLLISTDAVGSRLEQHKNAIEVAKEVDLKHIIYTSWPNPKDSLALVSPEHIETENIIKKSNLPYTILRNYPYAENLIGSLSAALQMGSLYGAAGDGRVAYVTRTDCAKAAAGALTSSVEESKIYDITGPQAFSYRDVVEVLSEVTSRELPYVDLSLKDYEEALVQSGLPQNVAKLYASFDEAFKNGEVDKTSNAVNTLTGDDPEGLKSFLIKNKAKLTGATHGK